MRRLPSHYTSRTANCSICFADITFEWLDIDAATTTLSKRPSAYTFGLLSSPFGGSLRCEPSGTAFVAMAMPCCGRPVCRLCVGEHVKLAKARLPRVNEYPSFKTHSSSKYQKLLRNKYDVLVQKSFEHLMVMCLACGRHTNWPLGCHYKKRVDDIFDAQGGPGQFSAKDLEDANYKKFGYEKHTKMVEATQLSVDGVNPLRRVRRGRGCYVGGEEANAETLNAMRCVMTEEQRSLFIEHEEEDDPDPADYLASPLMATRVKALEPENQAVAPIEAPPMTPSEMLCIIVTTASVMATRLDYKGADAHVERWAKREMARIKEKLPHHDPVSFRSIPRTKNMGFVYLPWSLI